MNEDRHNEFTILDLAAIWSGETNLKIQVCKLIDFIIDKKEIAFNVDDLDFQVNELLDKGILTDKQGITNGKKLKLAGNPDFFYTCEVIWTFLNDLNDNKN